MNLTRLLAFGRSLKGAKAVPGKYKLQQSMLPKFASTVRPSTTVVSTEDLKSESEPQLSLAESASSMPVADAKPVLKTQTELKPKVEPVRSMEKTQQIPTGKVLRRVEQEPAPTQKRFDFLAMVQTKMATLKKVLFPVRSRKKAGAALVQTEWSLEKVTVVRNDLSDSDIEIVAPKPQARVEPHKQTMPDLSRVKYTGKKWIKKTTSLFKTTSPFSPSDEAKKGEAEQEELVERI
jgi:hypothetical protein